MSHSQVPDNTPEGMYEHLKLFGLAYYCQVPIPHMSVSVLIAGTAKPNVHML